MMRCGTMSSHALCSCDTSLFACSNVFIILVTPLACMTLFNSTYQVVFLRHGVSWNYVPLAILVGALFILQVCSKGRKKGGAALRLATLFVM
jgi:hypothetical protein